MGVQARDVESIFVEALERREAVERVAYLDDACGGDPALRARVEALLRAHEAAGSFLELPEGPSGPPAPTESATGGVLVDVGGPTAATGSGATRNAGTRPLSEGPGSRIGPYRLIRSIGEGGMGVVFLAEQEAPVRRTVALKVIKPGMDSESVIARFETERQALALMDHPNIAKVLDAGATGSGRPYFVMELVRGAPLTDYCDQARLTVRQRLDLFLAVCRAVQHAHQKGIIHRDLKPSNVLVAVVDGAAVPKVIDFGVARAIDRGDAERSLFTRFGAVVGTPEYMSPEQAEGSGADVDTRSDIYSLGVLLYELLTGTTPLDRETLRTAALAEVLRRVREEEPPRPSTRLSGSGERLPAVAARRDAEPARLPRLVRGELDWVVMKALEKDRACRYETADAFARDLRRHLDGDPVEAGPPSRVYRLRKFIRKHRPALAVAASFALLLLAATVYSQGEARRARRAEGLAERRSRQARRAVDQMYTRFAQEWLANQPRLEQVQRDLLMEAMQFYQELAQEQGRDSSVQLDVARASLRVAQIHQALSHLTAALEPLRRARSVFRAMVDREPAHLEYRRGLAECEISLGVLERGEGHPEQSVQAFQRAVGLRREIAEENPGDPNDAYLLAAALNDLGRREAMEDAIATLDDLLARDPRNPSYRIELSNSRAYLGTWFYDRGDFSAAEPHHREALRLRRELVRDFPNTPHYPRRLMVSLTDLGRDLSERPATLKEAESIYRESLELALVLVDRSPAIPANRINLAIGWSNLGRALCGLGRLAEAEDHLRRGIALHDQVFDQHPELLRDLGTRASFQVSLGQVMEQTGREQAALESYRLAMATFDRGAERAANALQNQRRRAEARAHIARVLAGASDPGLRDAAEALRLARQAVDLFPESALCRSVLRLVAPAEATPSTGQSHPAEAGDRVTQPHEAGDEPDRARVEKEKIGPADLPAEAFAPP